jgi:hypothetical protein
VSISTQTKFTFIDQLKTQLELLGWEDVASQRHFGEEFDLVGSRWFRFFFLFHTQWNVLLKYIDVLDDEEVRRWTASFHHISAESKKEWPRCFMLCLVAGKVESDPEELTEARDSFGADQGGGGNIFVVDLTNRKIHGKVPWFPYDVRKFSRDLRAMFQGMFASE